VDEVIGRVNTLQRCIQRRSVTHITTNDLRGFPDQWSQLIRVSGQTSQDDWLAFEQRNQPTTDVT